MKIIIHTDGGARGNPGPAAIGVVINVGEKIIKEYGRAIGKATNNVAEYSAVISALEVLAKNLGEKAKLAEVLIKADSELIVKQLKGEYRVKDPDLQKLYIKVYNLRQKFGKIDYTHIPREQNKRADQLVNEALDKKG
ncbi:MAG TPA: ribonuclease HI family protein [Candidatus Pacearchaeota archaeon]|nr:ribonuclease HI family protein [Candidatus Pacearchaeota archaeon]